MKPWEHLAETRAPDGARLTLLRHDGDYVIRIDGHVLMTSRMHGSEEALAALGCVRARTLRRPRVLVGGLGMGYTARAALDLLPAAARVVVAELVPAVVEWNRGPLGPLANHPLDDPRLEVDQRDVVDVIRSARGTFDAVLLDVDNGAEAMTSTGNTRLYDAGGVAALRAALTPVGVLALWSLSDDRPFERRLTSAGFTVRRESVRARANGRGPRHVVLVASR